MQCERIGCNLEARFVTREHRHYCFGCRPTYSLPIEHEKLVFRLIERDVPIWFKEK